MLNSKIVNIYLNNDSSRTIEYITLDKLQIELNLDESSRFVIQFDDILLSCAACEHERDRQRIKSSKEYQLYLKKFARIKDSYLIKKKNLITSGYFFDLVSSNRKDSNTANSENDKSERLAAAAEVQGKNDSCGGRKQPGKKNKINSTSSSETAKLPPSNKQGRNSLNFIEAKRDELIATISNLIGCIGCRVSVERFYKQLIKNSEIISKINETIYPILIDSNENLTLNGNLFLVDPFKLYSIFYLNNSILKNETKMSTSSSTVVSSSIYTSNSGGSNGGGCFNANVVITTTTTSSSVMKSGGGTSATANSAATNINGGANKNRRCPLHSLDKAKLKSINDWLPVWHSFASESCRAKFILIDTATLLLTLHNYLRKHKFCTDCRLKVLRAYNLLTGELDSSKEKGFCSSLYEGIQHCSIAPAADCVGDESGDRPVKCEQNERYHLSKKHLHLKNNKEFVGNLIFKAELEIHGSRRERHAKTLEIAQEEVLTCIGIYLFEKFHKVYQLIKQEEQTWQLLLYASAVTLKKSFELEFERLQGFSNLELICAEFEAEQGEATSVAAVKKMGKNRLIKAVIGKKLVKKPGKTMNSRLGQKQIAQRSSSSSNSRSSESGNESNDSGQEDEIAKNNEPEEDYPDESEQQSYVGKTDSVDIASSFEIVSDEKSDLGDESPHHRGSSSPCDCDVKLSVETCASQSLMFNPLVSSSSSTSSSSGGSGCTSSPFASFDRPSDLAAHMSTHMPSSKPLSNSISSSAYSSFCCLSHECDCEDAAVAANFCSADCDCNDEDLITEEEKNEYYANKATLLSERTNRRELLRQRFQNLKLTSTLKIRPRHVS